MAIMKAAGFSIIEIVVAVSIFLVTVGAFITAYGFLHDLADRAADRTAAALALEEGAEAILVLRDQDWASLASLPLETGYTLYWDGAAYQVATTAPSGNGLVQHVTFFPVRRNAAGVLADDGTIDPDTRRVRIEVSPAAGGVPLATAEMLVHKTEQ